jgi:hypothetical protein
VASRFNSTPSSEWKTAAQALRTFAGSSEGHHLDGVCAEAMETRLRRYWAVCLGPELTGIEGPMKMVLTCCAASIGRTTQGKSHNGSPCRYIPGSDHLRGWAQNGTITAITIEPYGLSGDNILKLADFCREHNYKATIRGESAHYVGYTVLIAITDDSPESQERRRDFARARGGMTQA